jgi:molecular chaperone DnaJ
MKTENYESAELDYRKANDFDSTLNLGQKIAEAQRQIKIKKKNRDFYQILGVDRGATPQEIKKSFRKLSLKYHPDKVDESDEKENAAKKYQEIVEAHDVLKDASKKRKYDIGIYDDGSGCGGGGGYDDFFSTFTSTRSSPYDTYFGRSSTGFGREKTSNADAGKRYKYSSSEATGGEHSFGGGHKFKFSF